MTNSYIRCGRSFGKKKKSFREKVDFFLQSLWTMICPPLIYDWEVFYTTYRETLSVNQSYTQSKRMFSLFVSLFYIEHLILCLPIISLKWSIDQRNNLLEEYFSLLPEVSEIQFNEHPCQPHNLFDLDVLN